MTTTSSTTFPTMEIPQAEDSMEMASPYQGQADDFDIDIDLMEDHVSNMDSDMMGADDFPNTSQPSLFPNDVNDDADMADGPSEGSMIDADNLAQEDNDIDVQYEETTYEADMLEGDQIEVTGASIPSVHLVQPADDQHETHDFNQPAPEKVDLPQPSQAVSNDAASSVAHTEDLDQIAGKNEQDSPPGPAVPLEESAEVLEEIDTADHTKAELGEDTKEAIEGVVASTEEQRHVDSPAGDFEAPQDKLSPRERETGNAELAESYPEQEADGQATHEVESLHPVKVIYQDNEISLFPPLEGDSAETFFLHDEDVAYDNVDKLFKSLREVLMDNVAEDEILVIDIDSLGIQLTEDSSHTKKVTLHQILDVYLHLCYNDGTNEPEALYITLGSKPTVESELAGLEASAKEGKGLSQVQLWDDYGDAGLVEEETEHIQQDVESGEVSHSDKSRQVEPSAQPNEKQESVPHDAHDDEHTEGGIPQDRATATDEAGHEHDVVETRVEREDVEQTVDEYQESTVSHSNEEIKERDSAEALKTESSTTVAPIPETAGHMEAFVEEAVDVDKHASSRLGDAETEDEQIGSKDFGHEEHPEQIDVGGVDVRELHEENFDGPADNEGTGDDVHPVEIASIHSRENPKDANTALEDEDTLATTISHEVEYASCEQSEPTFDNAEQDDFAYLARTPEPGDDLLGIAEDLMQTPAQDRQNADAKDIECDETEHGTNGDSAADNHFSAETGDADFYPDFEDSEAIVLGESNPSLTDPHTLDNSTTKRSREEDDDWEVAGTTTPNTKRRRPS